MSNTTQTKLTEEARSEIRRYLWSLAIRGGAFLGAVNLAAVLGGYLFIVDRTADKASERAQRLTEERLAQADVLQQALFEGVGRSLKDVGQVQAEITQIQEDVSKAEAAIETLTGVGPRRLEALSEMIQRATDEMDISVILQTAFDRLARLEDSLQSRLSPPVSIEVGKVKKSESDGFVIVTVVGRRADSSIRIVEGFAGPRDPPHQRRAAISVAKAKGIEQALSFNMPVRRGEYLLIKDSAGPVLVKRSREADRALSVNALFFGLGPEG